MKILCERKFDGSKTFCHFDSLRPKNFDFGLWRIFKPYTFALNSPISDYRVYKKVKLAVTYF